MTVTVNLPPQVEQAYLAGAHAKGQSLEDFVRDVLLERQPHADPNQLPPDEWKRRFKSWTDSHGENTVVLPDEAMERESIYGDHGR